MLSEVVVNAFLLKFQMVSIERMKEYMSLEPEEAPAATVNEVSKLPYVDVDNAWPSGGSLKFDKVWLRYTGQDDWALRDINLDVNSGCKVGFHLH